MRLPASLLVALSVLAASAPAASAERDPRTITVTGTATLDVPNDQASFRFGVETRRSTGAAALSATAARVRSLLARLGSEGIAPADLTTDTIRVERVTRPGPGGRAQVVEFVATSTVTARVRAVAETGRIAAAAVAAGATSVDGPSFTASDPGATARLALVVAFQDARDKAARLADGAGVDLGGPISIREGIDVAPVAGREQASAPGADDSPRVPPPVRPGTSTVTANVTAVFEIS